MIGRERELEELNRELQGAVEGKGSTILISAEAGIGKTRLVTEFLKSVKQENITKLSGWCLFKAGVPYFPFIEAFSNYYSTLGEKSSREKTELNSWLKEPAKAELSTQLKYLTPQALKDQTFEVVAKTIRSIATQNPVIFVVEDIHWADSASLALLHYISRATHHSEKVLILATFRSEELTNDSEGYPHQLAETLVAMRREDLFRTIDLHNLTPSSITQIAESMLGGRLQQGLSEKLAVESEGSPLFAVESLRMLHEHNNLVQENDVWRLRTEKLGVPLKIRDILIQRLACLNNAQKRLLDAASVIGDYFEAGLLSAIVEQDSLEVLETLNVIAHSTSMILADESRFRFDHARSREIIYESLVQPLKQGYHKKIAETLENTKGKNLPFSELANHYAQSGNNEKAVKYAFEAGHDALLKWSNSEAIKHFEYVLKNLPKGQSEVKIAALDGLGDAYKASCMYDEAMKTFNELAESTTGASRLRAIRKAMDAAYDQGSNPDLLLTYARKAKELGVNDRLEMARIIGNRAKAWSWSGRGDAKMDLADYNAALRVFEEECSLVDVAEALYRSGTVSTFFEDSRERGLGQLLRSLAIFRELGEARKELETRMWLAQGFQCCGLMSEATRENSEVIEKGGKMGLFNSMAHACWQLSNIYSHRGKLEEALSIALKEFELCNKTDSSYRKGVACAQLAYLYSLNGKLEEADKYFNMLSELLPTDVLSNEMHGFCSFLGVYFFAKGQLDEANQFFTKAIEFYKKTNLPSEPWFRQNYAWVLEKQGCVDEARLQLSRAQKMLENLQSFAENKFVHANLHLNVLMPRYVLVGEEFEMRLELVNVSRNSGVIVELEGLIPQNAQIISFPSFCRVQDSSIWMNQRKIDPFQVDTIKLHMKLSEIGVYNSEPSVSYVDDLGTLKENKASMISITAQLNPLKREVKLKEITEPTGELVFKSIAAEKAFDYLVNAFKQDYIARKLPLEMSGWRTLTDVIKNAHVTLYGMYGQGGRAGKTTLELKHVGVVESRFFPGERGRGGQVLKLRVWYEHKSVRERIGLLEKQEQ